MRLSIDKRDPGFSHRAVGLRARIYLDGQEVVGCVTADEEESLIVRYKVKDDGKTLVKNDAGDAFVLETVRGKVRIDLLSADGGSLREPKVQVERDRETGAIYLYVYSRLRPKASKRVTIAKDKQPGIPARLEAMCGMLVAGVYEELQAEFGDFVEPVDGARMAGERLRELLAREDELLRLASSSH